MEPKRSIFWPERQQSDVSVHFMCLKLHDRLTWRFFIYFIIILKIIIWSHNTCSLGCHLKLWWQSWHGRCQQSCTSVHSFLPYSNLCKGPMFFYCLFVLFVVVIVLFSALIKFWSSTVFLVHGHLTTKLYRISV